ncbi:hypothetical protein ACO0QE_002718 [Hanseniaspora vineae]
MDYNYQNWQNQQIGFANLINPQAPVEEPFNTTSKYMVGKNMRIPSSVFLTDGNNMDTSTQSQSAVGHVNEAANPQAILARHNSIASTGGNLKFDPSGVPDISHSQLPLPDDDYNDFFDLNLEDFGMNDDDILANIDNLEIPSIPQESDLQQAIQKQTKNIANKLDLKNNDFETAQDSRVTRKRKVSGTAIFGFHNHDKTLLPENSSINAGFSSQGADHDSSSSAAQELENQQQELKKALEQQKILNLQLSEQLKLNQLQQEKLQSELSKQKQIMTSPQRELTTDGKMYVTSNSPQGKYSFPVSYGGYESPQRRDTTYSNNSSPIRPPKEQQDAQDMLELGSVSLQVDTLNGSPVRKHGMMSHQHHQQHNSMNGTFVNGNTGLALFENPRLQPQSGYPYGVQNYHEASKAQSGSKFDTQNNVLLVKKQPRTLSKPKLETSTEEHDEIRKKSTASNSTSHSTIPQDFTPMLSYGHNNKSNENSHEDFVNNRANGTPVHAGSIGLGLMRMAANTGTNPSAGEAAHTFGQSGSLNFGVRRESAASGCSREELLNSIVLKPPSFHEISCDTLKNNSNKTSSAGDGVDAEPESRFVQAQTPSPILKSQDKFEGSSSVNFDMPKKTALRYPNKGSSNSNGFDYQKHAFVNKRNDLYITPKLQSTPIFSSGHGTGAHHHNNNHFGLSKNSSPLLGFENAPLPSPTMKYVSIPSPVSSSGNGNGKHGHSNNNNNNNNNHSNRSPKLGRSPNASKLGAKTFEDDEHCDGHDHDHEIDDVEMDTNNIEGNHSEIGTTIGIINMSPKRIRKSSTLPPGTIDQYVVELPDKTFVCHYNQCWKKFHRRYNIRAHIQTHLQDKPHKCDYPGCTKSFVRNHDLKRHKKSHLEKTHICECGKKFNREDALEVHRERKKCVMKKDKKSAKVGEMKGGMGSDDEKVEHENVHFKDQKDQDIKINCSLPSVSGGAGVNKSPRKKQRSNAKPPLSKPVSGNHMTVGLHSGETLVGADAVRRPSSSSSSSGSSGSSCCGSGNDGSSGASNNISANNTSPVKQNIRKTILKNGEQDMALKVESLLLNKQQQQHQQQQYKQHQQQHLPSV